MLYKSITSGIPSFIVKLCDILNNEENHKYVDWSLEHDKKAFVVWDPVEFSTSILPNYFKHSNFSSFIRQLNIYGFKKLESSRGYVFKHDYFQYGKPQLLLKIQRRKYGVKKSKFEDKDCNICPCFCFNSNEIDFSRSNCPELAKYVFAQALFLQKQSSFNQILLKALKEVL